jgi:hypothetical protein
LTALSTFFALSAGAFFCLQGEQSAAQTLPITGPQTALLQPISPPGGYSSSEAEGLAGDPADKRSSAAQAEAAEGQSQRPFSRLGMAVTGGTGGIGLELATPLSSHFNVRAKGSYFSYYLDFETSGYDVTGRILVRQAGLSVDYYPFRHSGFRLSPGVTLDNANAVHGQIVIPGGQEFDLGDATYTSEVGAPISGNVALSFGKRVAPSFTLGWGNLIPRRPHRFSVPVEIGFEYIGPPQVNFNLYGYACDNMGDCYDITQDPGTQANVAAERTKINNDIYPLRFFPIASIGFGFVF